jgi:hypothetical protein
MGRADTPGGWWPVALVLAPLLYFPLLVGSHVVGQVATLDERAVIILRLDQSVGGRLVRALVTVASTVIVWGVFFAVGYATIPPLAAEVALRSHSRDVGQAFGTVASVVFCLSPTFAMIVTRLGMLRAIVTEYPYERAARARLGGGLGGGVRVAGFAAWPQHCGHGSRLAEAVKPVLESAVAASGRPLIVFARTIALAQVYQRWGLRPVTPGSRVLISDLPPVTT